MNLVINRVAMMDVRTTRPDHPYPGSTGKPAEGTVPGSVSKGRGHPPSTIE
jgi:hypothetical protein